MQRIIKRVLLIILTIAILAFLLRGFVVDLVFKRMVARAEARYGWHIIVADKKVTGITGVQLLHLTVLPAKGDTLLIADSVYVRPSFFNLLVGRLKLNELNIANMQLHFSCKDSACNYATAREENTNASQPEHKRNYAAFARKLSSSVFDLLPGEVALRNINIRIDKDSIHEDISISLYESADDQLQGTLQDNKSGAHWNITGTISQDNNTFDLKFFPGGENSKGLPLVKSFSGGYCNFDSLEIVLGENNTGTPVRSRGVVHGFNLDVVHPKLSDDTIHIADITGLFSVSIGENFIELDSSSYVQLNNLPVAIYARYEKDTSASYSLVIKTGEQDAGNFFSSLPRGMFSELQGIEADGTLDFALRFHLDSSQPDSLDFTTQMKKKKFRIKKYGESGLTKMNGEFLYTAYEKNRPVASFMVGYGNPDFVPLEKISPYFRNAVLTSEDGSFFYHNGFNEDAFRKSIAANYKAGKFVRGGSTITMQLVKNVFLTRKKTIARKAEEAFIVWLIESNNLCSKERMFEVYLNIIELGPGVYGAKNASLFYFDKLPHELTLSESIFLASLLPRPKWFKYSFDAQGNLKPYLGDYYRVVSNFMLKKGLITEPEYDSIEPRVELKGPAKGMVVPSDTIPGEYVDELPD